MDKTTLKSIILYFNLYYYWFYLNVIVRYKNFILFYLMIIINDKISDFKGKNVEEKG